MVSSRKFIVGGVVNRLAWGECNNSAPARRVPRVDKETAVSDVRIETETEDHDGWTFRLHIAAENSGRPTPRTLRLSWADYDLWSADGADPPHAVAAAVVAFLLARLDLSDLPPRIDASMARRQFAGADDEIPKLIRR
ncbi:MAG: hypothetical protein ACYSU7_11170 [Planctomycetota bacterium]|jgi:hypothetical protein